MCYNNSMKIIEAIEQCTEARLRGQLLEYPHNPEIIELSKNYYMNKNIFVGNKWGWLKLNANALIDIEYWCWCPLGFEGNILYG